MISPQRLSLGFCGALALAAMAGCADKDTTAVDEDDEADSEETASDTEESETGDPEELGPLALGIDIVDVEANQGTAVLIGQAGEWVGPEGRNAYMIRDRDTLVRLQHTVHEGWVPREIVGILHLEADGVELQSRTRTFFVEGNSDPKSLTTEFYFSILAEEAKPGLEFWVELREASPDFDAGGAAAGVVVTPPNYELVGYEQTPLEMKVMLVPIEYTYIDPPTLAEITESDLQVVHDALLETNPLQTVTLEVHEPYEYDNQITNLGSLLGPMAALRTNDAAEPNQYYHALVDVNGPAVNMVAGIAQLPGSSKGDAISRVAATVWFKTGDAMSPAGSAGTLVHEIGHNQGLSHVYCPAASTPAAGPDPNYPHEDGAIGVYGFGIRSFRLYTPTGAHDYMTYCGNAWVSDWTWNKTYERIDTLTQWDYEGAPPPNTPDQPILVGTLFEDGSEQWWAMQGPVPAPDQRGAEHRINLLGPNGELLDEQYTAVSTLSDGATLMVIAPLTVPFEQLGSIERIDWRGGTHPIDRAEISLANGILAGGE